MATSLRFGSALSVIALATTVGGCSGLTAKSGRTNVAASAKVGLATRAQFALASKDYAGAIGYAEQAAEASPKEWAVRTLLGNTYFAAGRFASAEGAYRDSLSLNPNQPQVILKLALVQIAKLGFEVVDAPIPGVGFCVGADEAAVPGRLQGGACRRLQLLSVAERHDVTEPGHGLPLRSLKAVAVKVRLSPCVTGADAGSIDSVHFSSDG